MVAMPTYLYLIQHAQAKSKEVDPQRSLTEAGEQDVSRLAVLAARIGISVAEIRHSGKRRAEQTAAILAEKLSPAAVRAVAGIDPNDDVRPIAEALQTLAEPVMLVGHLPFLARLVGYLVVHDPDRTIVHFEPGTMVVLGRTDQGYAVEGVIPPWMSR
jgi:phosphohistidine phosphatase